MRQRFVHTLLRAMDHRDDIMILSGDAGLGVFDGVQKERPDAFLNMGVAEQNMASFGAGMALTGFKVVLYNIAPFVLYRCYEQVRNSICYMELPIILVGTGCGLTYAPSGMTHYSVEDIGVARTIPGLTVLSPCDPMEAAAAAQYALAADHPVYVRIAKSGEPEYHESIPMDITKPMVLKPGNDAAIVVHGPVVEEALHAREILTGEGIRTRVISVPQVHPLNNELLASVLRGVEAVVVVEEQFIGCGLGARMLMMAGQGMLPYTIRVLGIPDDGYIHDICNASTLRRHFKMDAAAVVKTVLDMFGRRPML
nr:transketolase C-terminal domain-containing protein [uncultured Desulfobacter sp.]